jgi:hypothetical protein
LHPNKGLPTFYKATLNLKEPDEGWQPLRQQPDLSFIHAFIFIFTVAEIGKN